MERIELTQGQVALIDDDDFELVSRYKWYAQWKKNTKSFWADTKIPHPCGGKRRDGQARQTALSMHRLIIGLEFGDKRQIDHINHDTLDNRQSNLRIATIAENLRNRSGPQVNNQSGFLGVRWLKEKEKWMAYIKKDGKQIYLGLFDDRIEAAKARDTASLEFFGEFATLNFLAF